MARRKLSWWQKHWDEVMLVVTITAGIILLLVGLAVI